MGVGQTHISNIHPARCARTRKLAFALLRRKSATGRLESLREGRLWRSARKVGNWRDRAGRRMGSDYTAMERSKSQKGGNLPSGSLPERARSATSGLSRSVKRRSCLGPFETFVVRGRHSTLLWRSTVGQAQRLLYLRELFRLGAVRKADEPHRFDQPLALRFIESGQIDKSLDGQIGKPPECVRY